MQAFVILYMGFLFHLSFSRLLRLDGGRDLLVGAVAQGGPDLEHDELGRGVLDRLLQLLRVLHLLAVGLMD